MFQVFLEQWIPWDDTPVDERLVLDLDYDTFQVGLGAEILVNATVSTTSESGIRMALVELTAPVGMSFDTWDFEDLRELGSVDNVEYEDGVVRLYINDLNNTHPVTFQYHLNAELEAKVTLAGCRVFDMYNALVEMELPPIEITIDA